MELHVSDFLREVDEDYRREQMTLLWKRYGWWVIGAVIAIIAMVAAGVLWRDHAAAERGRQAEAYQAAIALADAGETEAALASLQAVVADGGGTATLAMLTRARLLAANDRRDEAVSAYQVLAAHDAAPPELRSLGSLRAAMLRLDSAPTEELQAELSALAVPGQPWAASASELLALALLRDGKPEAARNYLDLLFADPQTPAEIRTRAGYYLELIGPPPTPASDPAPEAQPQDSGETP